MNIVHIIVIPMAALSILVTCLGCSGAEPDATTPNPSAAAPEHTGGYGYEFNVDKVSASAPRADAPTESAKVSEGRIPPETIREVIHAREGALKGCYEQAVKRDAAIASATSAVTVRFTIRPDGSVGGAKSAGADVKDDALITCVTGAFSALSFPASPSGPVAVVYPIELSR